MVGSDARVFGILPTYRRQELLADTLRKTFAQSRPPDELVIVDNEQSDDTRRIVDGFAERHRAVPVTFLQAPENLGSAGGWELGMTEALRRARPHDWIATLDDDDPPQAEDELERMYQFAVRQHTEHADLAAVGIVGARFNWRTGYLTRVPDGELTGPVSVDYVGSGHGAMYLAKVMQDMGVFRGELFFGHTEIEYCLRLRRAGYRVLANGVVWREHRAASGRLGIRPVPERLCVIKWQKYYVTRNYIFMMREFRRYDLALKRALIQSVAKPLYTLTRSPATAYRGFKLGLRASIDGFVGRMGRTVDPSEFPNAPPAGNK